MKSMSKVVMPLVVLAVVFGLLRIYGAYQNEKKTALFMAAQASEAAKTAELEVAEDDAHGACVSAWLKYNNEEKKADVIRLEKGDIAYYREKERILGDKPTCSEPDTSLGAILDPAAFRHIEEEYNYWYLAALANRYASDRKLQTRHLLRLAWAKITGAAPDTPEEFGKFLAQSYPDIKAREWPGER